MSKLGRLGAFFKNVGHIAPAVLVFTPLAPIAPFVSAAVMEAEAIGGSGPEKLTHVLNIAHAAAAAANAQAGKVVVDPAAVDQTAAAVVTAIVQAVNLIDDPTPLDPAALPGPVQP